MRNSERGDYRKSQHRNLHRRKEVKTTVIYQKHAFVRKLSSTEMNSLKLFTRESNVIQIASSTFTYCSHISHYPGLIKNILGWMFS